jgi:cell wall-associated NlpC family hydrolase
MTNSQSVSPPAAPDTEATQRRALVHEALSWQHTKFSHGQCLKGVAADCSTFIAACYREVGVFQATVPHLAPDWFVHTSKEWYLGELMQHAVEFDPKQRPPQPGDIVLVKDSAVGAKVFSHAAIVVNWPTVIHCFPPVGVMRSDLRSYPCFQNKALRFFNPWGVAATK